MGDQSIVEWEEIPEIKYEARIILSSSGEEFIHRNGKWVSVEEIKKLVESKNGSLV